MAQFFNTATIFTYSLVSALNLLWELFTTPLNKIETILPEDVPSFVSDVLSSLLGIFGKTTIADVMFGSLLVIFVLYTFYKWVK